MLLWPVVSIPATFAKLVSTVNDPLLLSGLPHANCTWIICQIYMSHNGGGHRFWVGVRCYCFRGEHRKSLGECIRFVRVLPPEHFSSPYSNIIGTFRGPGTQPWWEPVHSPHCHPDSISAEIKLEWRCSHWFSFCSIWCFTWSSWEWLLWDSWCSRMQVSNLLVRFVL